MTTKSAKAKGRRLQQQVCTDLVALAAPYGLTSDDIQSRPMSSAGEDIILSPAARRRLYVTIECKNRETLNVTTAFAQHAAAHGEGVPLLVHHRNQGEVLATLRWAHLCTLLRHLLHDTIPAE